MGDSTSISKLYLTFDPQVRAWCAKNQIYFQSFGMLPANRESIKSETIQTLAQKYRVTPEVLFLRFAIGLDMVPMMFTLSYEEMMEDLSALQVPLTARDAEIIATEVFKAPVFSFPCDLPD